MMGTCKGCGTPNVELNEDGMCEACAAKTAETGTETEAE
jgi:hypothetical protein